MLRGKRRDLIVRLPTLATSPQAAAASLVWVWFPEQPPLCPRVHNPCALPRPCKTPLLLRQPPASLALDSPKWPPCARGPSCCCSLCWQPAGPPGGRLAGAARRGVIAAERHNRAGSSGRLPLTSAPLRSLVIRRSARPLTPAPEGELPLGRAYINLGGGEAASLLLQSLLLGTAAAGLQVLSACCNAPRCSRTARLHRTATPTPAPAPPPEYPTTSPVLAPGGSGAVNPNPASPSPPAGPVRLPRPAMAP